VPPGPSSREPTNWPCRRGASRSRARPFCPPRAQAPGRTPSAPPVFAAAGRWAPGRSPLGVVGPPPPPPVSVVPRARPRGGTGGPLPPLRSRKLIPPTAAPSPPPPPRRSQINQFPPPFPVAPAPPAALAPACPPPRPPWPASQGTSSPALSHAPPKRPGAARAVCSPGPGPEKRFWGRAVVYGGWWVGTTAAFPLMRPASPPRKSLPLFGCLPQQPPNPWWAGPNAP